MMSPKFTKKKFISGHNRYWNAALCAFQGTTNRDSGERSVEHEEECSGCKEQWISIWMCVLEPVGLH